MRRRYLCRFNINLNEVASAGVHVFLLHFFYENIFGVKCSLICIFITGSAQHTTAWAIEKKSHSSVATVAPVYFFQPCGSPNSITSLQPVPLFTH